jgi:hypothetical protein
MEANGIEALRAAARGERVHGPIDAATAAAAAQARMAGLLARAADEPPRELQLHAAAIAARSLSFAKELARICDAFRAAGVPLLALKGPVASQQLYGDLTLRSFADVDVIAEDAVRGEAILRDLGYDDGLTAAQRATKHRFHNGTAFSSKTTQTTIDFHWRFGHVQFPLALAFGDAWERRSEVSLAGTTVATLGLTDLALFTCSHAAKHFWTPFETLAQIAALTRLPIDWETLDSLAVSARAARQVGLSFLVAREMVGCELPPLPRCLAASRAPFDALRVTLPAERDAGGRDLFLILDRRRDALAAMAASIFVPTDADWSAATLPAPLYWLTRPWRLAAARLRR